MRLGEELERGLTEIIQHGGDLSEAVGVVLLEGLYVHHVVVGDMREDIECLASLLTALAIAKHEINPLVDVLTDVLALEGIAVNTNKVFSGFCPGWQNNIVDGTFSVLTFSQIKPTCKGLSLYVMD